MFVWKLKQRSFARFGAVLQILNAVTLVGLFDIQSLKNILLNNELIISISVLFSTFRKYCLRFVHKDIYSKGKFFYRKLFLTIICFPWYDPKMQMFYYVNIIYYPCEEILGKWTLSHLWVIRIKHMHIILHLFLVSKFISYC